MNYLENQPPIVVKTSEGYEPAFWNYWHQDYVIELGYAKPTREEVENDIASGKVYYNMPDRLGDK